MDIHLFNKIIHISYDIIEKAGNICDSAGMYCLHKKNWSSTACKCLKLCEENIFIIKNIAPVVSLISLLFKYKTLL